MTDRIRQYLISNASKGRLVYYGELVEQLDLPFNLRNTNERSELGVEIGNISIHEFSRGRPPLSCLVVRKDTNMPGGDFFKALCEESLEMVVPKTTIARQKLHREMVEECHNFWKDPVNYSKYMFDY